MASGDAPRPSAGCTGGTLEPGRTVEMMDSGGQMRSYIQYVPPSYKGGEPVPLLFDLHGGGFPATSTETNSGYKALADKEGFIYLAPDAIGMMWSAYMSGDVQGEDRDEVFLRALLERVGAAGCIDLKRVYASGCSMGGAQSFVEGCFASDIIAAIAPWCGTAFFDLFTRCKPKRPVPVMLTLGADDLLNCWDGDSPPVGKQCAKGVQEAFKMIDQCPGPVQPSHDGVCETLEHCVGASEVTICKVQTGHVVYTATDLNVAQASWDFLKRFQLP